MRRLLHMMLAAGLLAALAAGLLAGLATAPPARAAWRSLSGPLPPHAEVWNVTLSPDGKYVAYLADVDPDHRFELYSVALAGGTPLKLNPPLPPGGGVHDELLAFTPDSQSILYVAEQEVAGQLELYRVPVTGGAVEKLNAPLVPGGNVVDFELHPDGSTVVYIADQQTDETYELWSVVGDNGPVKRNTALTVGGDVDNFVIDPFNNRIVYSADQNTDGTYELYTTPLADAGFAEKLNPPLMLTDGQDEGLRYDYALSPTAPVVVFVARVAESPGGKLYANATAGGALTALSEDTPATQRLIDFHISPSGSRVVYNLGTNSATEKTDRGMLFSTPIDGGPTSALSEPADPMYGVLEYSFTPASERVVSLFQTNQASPARVESATLDNNVRTTLFEDTDPQMPLLWFYISADGARVFIDQGNVQKRRQTAYPVAGGAGVSYGVSGPAATTPDGSRVVFMRNEYTGGTPGLFSVPISGGDERDLSGLRGGAAIKSFELSPDGKWIVYTVWVGDRYELRVSDGTAAHAAVAARAAEPMSHPAAADAARGGPASGVKPYGARRSSAALRSTPSKVQASLLAPYATPQEWSSFSDAARVLLHVLTPPDRPLQGSTSGRAQSPREINPV